MPYRERFWNRVARRYDRRSPRRQESLLRTIESIKRYLEPEDQVLDFACGTGEKALGVAGCVQSIHGIDLSPEMIERASVKAIDRQVDNARFSRTDLFDATLEPGSYDAIMAFYVLHLVDDLSQVLRRFEELLKPGGRLICEMPCLGELGAIVTWGVALVGRLGVQPRVRCFQIAELESMITDTASLQLVESRSAGGSKTDRFILAKRA
jgi:2-polyprenyl-3-methyl-5-hydroxy-6-metoxy-1,4-benzoquinol methylase